MFYINNKHTTIVLIDYEFSINICKISENTITIKLDQLYKNCSF